MIVIVKINKSWSGEPERITKSGRISPAYERTDVIKHSGKNAALIGIRTHITENKRMEETLCGEQ